MDSLASGDRTTYIFKYIITQYYKNNKRLDSGSQLTRSQKVFGDKYSSRRIFKKSPQLSLKIFVRSAEQVQPLIPHLREDKLW